jgi:hypothetical protein
MQQLEQLRQFEEDMDWITQHYEELKRHYPEQYVAVYRHAVADHDEDMKSLMARLKERYGEHAKYLAIEFITVKKDELIL